MGIEFKDSELVIGGTEWTYAPFRFSKILRIGGGVEPTWRDVVISGITALTLVNAKADGLNYLKLFGGIELLPETYLDTVTLSGGCEQRNLPVGYTQVEYASFDGTTETGAYVDTGIAFYTDIPNNKIRIRTKVKVYNQSVWQVICGNLGALSAYVGINPENKIAYGIGAPDIITNTLNIETFCIFDLDLANGTFKVTNLSTGTDIINITGITPTLSSNVRNILLGGYNNTAGTITINRAKMDLAWAEIYNDGALYSNLYACKNSSNTVGFYDTVRNIYITNVSGTNALTAGPDVVVPSPTNPIDIVCNNGAIKVSRNLFDEVYPNITGAPTYRAIYVGEGTFTCSYSMPHQNNNVSMIYFLRGNVSTGASNGENQVDATHPRTVTAVNGYVTIAYRNGSSIAMGDAVPSDYHAQIEKGSTATPYMPYGQIYTDGTQEVVTDSVGNTATAQMLLSVGTYKDTQEVLSGSVTRNVGIKVLDGTETWVAYQGISGLYYSEDTITGNKTGISPFDIISTHFISTNSATMNDDNTIRFMQIGVQPTVLNNRLYIRYTATATLSAWTTYLADQYAQGTPVIVVYPLATATTESVTGQFLSKSPVTQTAGSISNLPIAETSSSHTTPTPQQPLPINCNNGVVKLSPNLFDITALAGSTIVSYSGDTITITGGTNVFVGKTLKQLCPAIEAGKTYYLSMSDNSTTPNKYIWLQNGSSGGQWMNNTTKTLSQADLDGEVKMYCSAVGQTIVQMQIELGSTPTTYRPYGQIYTDGTTETVEVHSENLFNKNNATMGVMIEVSTGAESTSSSNRYSSDYIIVKPNTVYSCNGFDDTSGVYGIAYYDKNKVFVSGDAYTSAIVVNKKVTIPNNSSIKYMRFCSYGVTAINDCMFIESNTLPTDYIPYFNGGTATAEDLLKVGTYQDVQSVLDGEVTRNVGVKVLDGSGTWSALGNTGKRFRGPAITNALNAEIACSHYRYDSTSDIGDTIRLNASKEIIINGDIAYATPTEFTNWLADQYNSGNPVVIVYPLETATTETVTAQPLTIQAGTNIVEITQASMDNLELEVSYKAGVTVTITEVQNANIDNSVEVTING